MVLHLIRLVLFVFLLSILPALLYTLHDISSVLVSLLDLFSLSLQVVTAEVGPLTQLVDIGDFVLAEEQFCKILEDCLDIFVVEPKDSSFGGLDVLDDPNRHGVFGIFPKPMLFSYDDLFVS